MTWDILAAQLISSCCDVISSGTAWDMNHCALVQRSLIQRTFGSWEKRAGGIMQGSLGTVSSQYGSRMYLVMSQQKSFEEEYAVR